MSKKRILSGLCIGVFGASATAVLGGGGLTDGPPGARAERVKNLSRSNLVGTAMLASVESFGDPIPGLNSRQLERFFMGRVRFNAAWSYQEGLGPTFNADSCSTCHSDPVAGGMSGMKVSRIGRYNADGSFDAMEYSGGPVIQTRGLVGCLETRPGRAAVVSERVTLPLFGAGLIEAISDETILDNADPDDLDGDGISGRAHLVFDPYVGEMRVGRFGWKASVATLETIAALSSLQNLGITTNLFMVDEDPNGSLAPGLGDCDDVSDPEDIPDATGVSQYERVTDFIRYLSPPPALGMRDVSGLNLFRAIGCSDCHTPMMFTRSGNDEALSRKPVALFSDLLLHDMGNASDGIGEADADPSEMRTAPLWGLRARTHLWHDGRFEGSSRVHDAIEAHSGEATESRLLWERLSPEDQRTLLAFLGSI